MKKIIRENPIIVMIVLMIISTCGVHVYIGEGKMGMIPVRLFLGIVISGVLYIVIGKEMFNWTEKSGRYAFSRSICLLLYNCLASIWIIVCMANYNNLVKDWLYQIIVCLLLSMSVAFFEEGLFRGIIVNGLVKVMSNTKAGICWAVVISGFIFGFAHVYQYVLYITVNPISIIVQVICKIIVIGATGMLLATIYLKTKNIWVCMIIHALNDFLGFLGVSLLNIRIPSSINVYKTMNLEKFIPYLVMIVLMGIPNLVISLKILKNIEPSECTIWK